MKKQILNALEKIIDARDVNKITEITVIIDGDDWTQITAETYDKEDNKEEISTECKCDGSCEKNPDELKALLKEIFGIEDDKLRIKFLDK